MMELDINIQKLGKIHDVFGLYAFINASGEHRNTALLESVAGPAHKMLFSFIGVDPDAMMHVRGADLEVFTVISEAGELLKSGAGDGGVADESKESLPFEDDVKLDMPAIDALHAAFPVTRQALPELFPRKVFSGGLLGYIGYDVVAPAAGYVPASGSPFPDVLMGLYTSVLAYSHASGTVYQITNGKVDSDRGEAVQRLFNAYTSSEPRDAAATFDVSSLASTEHGFAGNTTRDKWEGMIDTVKEHVLAGDIIQAVVSRKMVTDAPDVAAIDVYQAMRVLNPSPYMFFLNFDEVPGGPIRLAGSSPEALVTKSRAALETVPIAGTRRRGRSPEDETRMIHELMHSEKEMAEHVMLVDLARNDLARVSVPGTVDTYELASLATFPNVMHITSRIRATSHLDPFTILKSMFPAGTVSGAPKLRAMEIIHGIEVEDRGPYAGCAGYVSFAGDMDMAISIRTLFNAGSRYVAQAGAGIVADSTAQEEFIETGNKLRGILPAINAARQLAGRR